MDLEHLQQESGQGFVVKDGSRASQGNS
jgi:hypothetical protein